jgi:integrase
VAESYYKKALVYATFLTETDDIMSAESIIRYLDSRAEAGMSASTICLEYSALKKFAFAYIDNQPKTPDFDNEMERYQFQFRLQRVRLPKRQTGRRAAMVQGLTQATLDKVLAKATPRQAAVVEMFADTGMRVSELINLRVRHVRRYTRTFATVTIIGKGSKERSLFIRTALLDRVRRIFKGQNRLFETQDGNPYDRKLIYSMVRTVFEQHAGITLSPHNLRHYHAMYMLKRGTPGQVAKALGHASPSTTAMFYDSMTLPKEVYNIKHHGQRGAKGGNPNGRKPKNLQAPTVSEVGGHDRLLP